jgi:hypothetical protein
MDPVGWLDMDSLIGAAPVCGLAVTDNLFRLRLPVLKDAITA